MCSEETPLEHEDRFIEILNDTLQDYIDHNHTSNHIVDVITSYIFRNEYYFRRDGHRIDIKAHTITIYLYQSKFGINLFKITVPICGKDFLHYIDSIYSMESTPNDNDSIDEADTMTAWIDTECKEDSFCDSAAANMVNNSCFLMMIYFEQRRKQITPWLAQWKYNSASMPYICVIARIISYPSEWNYVTISYVDNVSIIFYTSQEQHTIIFIPQKDDTESYKEERVSVIKFGSGLNYPWLMFGSAATKLLSYDDVILLFGNELYCSMDKESEYFVTRSCKDFIEMRDHGAFWTSTRDYISIFEITDKRDYYHCIKKEVDLNVQCQLPLFANIDNECYTNNILDVTITRDWSISFQTKYGIQSNHRLFMVLYSEIRHDVETTQLYAVYINVRGGKVAILRRVTLASSNCLTKFLVGRGCYQTVYNDWLCTLIGVDQHNHEVRHQLRLTEELELLYHQKVKRNENVQEVTNRYKCKALKWFKRANKEELEMNKANEAPNTVQMLWHHIVESRHLILSTLVGVYLGWRVTRMMRRGGRWTFRFTIGL